MQKTTFPFIAIVHDDASTDDTPEIIKEYEDTIKVRLSSEDNQKLFEKVIKEEKNFMQQQYDLTEEEVKQLVVSLKMSGIFDVIIWDMDFSFKAVRSDLMQLVSDIVMISDGSEISNSKIKRFYDSMEALEKQRKLDISDKLWILYNKFSKETGKGLNIPEIKELGGAPCYVHATVNQIIEQLLKLNIYEKLVL